MTTDKPRHPSNFIELTNKEFGALKVIEIEHSKNWTVYWKCECKCGKIVIKPTTAIVRGKYSSCGKWKPPKEIHYCAICGGDIKVSLYNKTNQYLCGRHKSSMINHGYIKERFCIDRNKIIINDKYAEIEIYNIKSDIVGYSKIDIEDIEKVCTHKWCMSRKREKPYVHSRFTDGVIQLHRFLLNISKDKNNKLVVDHINGDTLDNRKCNLRICTNQQNTMNSMIGKNNTSGITGVYWDKSRSKWEVEIMLNRKKIHLGRYGNKEDAIKARKLGEEKYFGEYAYKG